MMDHTLRCELTGLLARIIGDRPLPEDLRRATLESVLRLLEPSDSMPKASGTEGIARLIATAGKADASSNNARVLIYVHGICRHDAGFSNEWWNALRPFVNTFGDGSLNQSRLEVVWSDLVNRTAMVAAGSDPMEIGAHEQARSEIAASIRETLQDRADQQYMAAAVTLGTVPTVRNEQGTMMGAATFGGGSSFGWGAVLPPPVATLEMITGPAFGLAGDHGATSGQVVLGGGGLGGSCLDDFSVYLVHGPTRQAIIDRFTSVVRPQLAMGREIDLISHSWGTVVAYEGLRELEDGGISLKGVRNFFTVGAALSIGAVKVGLRRQNRSGRKPAGVHRWVNLNARGDLVGGPLQSRPFAVDEDRVNLEPFGCGSFLGIVNPSCSHSSYFQLGNDAVNRDIFARFINI